MHIRLLLLVLGVVAARCRVGNVRVREELANSLGVVGPAVLEFAVVHHDDIVGLGEELDLECASWLDESGAYESAGCMHQFAVNGTKAGTLGDRKQQTEGNSSLKIECVHA